MKGCTAIRSMPMKAATGIAWRLTIAWISVARFSKEKRRYTRHFAVGVYNAYSRKNPFFIYAGQDDFGNDAYKQVSLFPILPSFSWQFDF